MEMGMSSNPLGGTTITTGGGKVVGFTVRDGWYFTAYAAAGRNMTRIGSYDSNRQAVAALMDRRAIRGLFMPSYKRLAQ